MYHSLYKCLNEIAPRDVSDKISCNNNFHNYCTGSVNDLHVKNLTLHFMPVVLK